MYLWGGSGTPGDPSQFGPAHIDWSWKFFLLSHLRHTDIARWENLIKQKVAYEKAGYIMYRVHVFCIFCEGQSEYLNKLSYFCDSR